MSVLTEDPVIDRGIALHKMIRLATITMGGEGYLNFMGNEFGHPEWIDFPREGNGWSHFYCRRQWHLVDDQLLKYKYLNEFDKAMIGFVDGKKILSSPAKALFIDSQKQILMYECAGYVFILNFSPTNSYEDYWITVPTKGKYKVEFSTDAERFGGFNRVSEDYIYTANIHPDGNAKLQIYLPSRTGICMKKVTTPRKKK